MNLLSYPQHSKRQAGSVLMVALLTAFIIGLGLASYLTLIHTQNLSVARSQAWNAALAVAEAGVEEALAQLNPSAMLFNTAIDRGANGWSFSDNLYRPPSRTLLDGHYDVAVTADKFPIIYATGYVRVPLISEPVVRKVKVKTVTSWLFGGSMVARVDIDFKGFRVETDSFDSSTELKSTGGLYDINKRQDQGDVASSDGLLNVGNAKVMGTLWTGPEGNYTLGPGGSVGDLGYVSGGSSGLQQGHYRNDFNMDFPDVLPPFSSGFTPSAGSYNGTNYTWVLEGNNSYYVGGALKPKTGETILVAGHARLYVTGDFLMQGGAKIIILPTANLELYVGGANTVITTVNNAGNCSSFQYYGLPSNVSISLSGNDVFLGTFYAPNAVFNLGGGGKTETDFQGACVVKTIKMNGHFKFHFDEALKRSGPQRGYLAASWEEL